MIVNWCAFFIFSPLLFIKSKILRSKMSKLMLFGCSLLFLFAILVNDCGKFFSPSYFYHFDCGIWPRFSYNIYILAFLAIALFQQCIHLIIDDELGKKNHDSSIKLNAVVINLNQWSLILVSNFFFFFLTLKFNTESLISFCYRNHWLDMK